MINDIKTIRVNASKGYDIKIGKGILENTGELILKVINKCKLALITDDTVDALYSKTVINSLENSGFSVIKFVFPHGEKSKNLSTYGQILEFLAENELTRTDAIVALGGGVVGDMAGFCAASYLRGIKYIQIPTTLLAQIDSSVGGKTAIDLDHGKNLAGAFYQPDLVICDALTLKSLPIEVYFGGLGEAVKYAILDKNIFTLMVKGKYDLMDLICLCVEYKKNIVEEDEFEKGKRKFLNLGHTVAHGIEKLSKYTISHGKAVAMGIQIIAQSSFKKGYLNEKDYNRITHWIDVLFLGDYCPYDLKEVCQSALNDKKRSGDDITLVMICGIGEVKLEKIKVASLTEYLC